MSMDVEATDRMVEGRSTSEPDWNAVFTEQLPRVYNYFRYRLDNEADVQDLTSRTFEKAWRARDRYRSERAGYGTWLLRIAHNVAVDHLRLVRNHAPLEAAVDTAADCGPETAQEQASDQARLQSLIPALPARERELLALKYGAGASNREIAIVMGLSESNVGTILHRTVQALREQW
jgi:RNA polymerase sigma-70 factor (ECF subfamily)